MTDYTNSELSQAIADLDEFVLDRQPGKDYGILTDLPPGDAESLKKDLLQSDLNTARNDYDLSLFCYAAGGIFLGAVASFIGLHALEQFSQGNIKSGIFGALTISSAGYLSYQLGKRELGSCIEKICRLEKLVKE